MPLDSNSGARTVRKVETMDRAKKLEEGRRVFDIEIKALERVRDCLGDVFVDILDEIMSCRGKVVITGMGKPGHIAKKLAATFSSLGTPAFCLHPGEAMHGDLGMVDSDDLVIAISYSGESDEVINILPNIKLLGAKIVAITGNCDSTLAQAADLVQVLPEIEEACHLGLAPTSSTTAALVYGDALAVAIAEEHGFNTEDFGRRHPAGSLGKKLIMRVDDLMAQNHEIPKVLSGSLLMDALRELSNKRLGAVCVVNEKDHVIGIITDGDLRRFIEQRLDIYSIIVDEVMTLNPKTTVSGILAVDALAQIREQDINGLPVLKDGHLVGMVTWQQIVGVGIVA